MQAFGRNQISVQVSGFRIWGVLTPDTYNPIPDDSSGFTLTTHLRILLRSYDLRLYRKVIFIDTIPGTEVFRNLKLQASNFIIQCPNPVCNKE